MYGNETVLAVGVGVAAICLVLSVCARCMAAKSTRVVIVATPSADRLCLDRSFLLSFAIQKRMLSIRICEMSPTLEMAGSIG